jgi:hypothetical protein
MNIREGLHTKLRVIITGATGMVGEGVLHQCLNDERVEKVLLLSRKAYGLPHPKLKELLHDDFFNLSAVENQLSGYNACFFCLGVSSIGLKEPEYTRLTYTLTLHVAETLSRLNQGMGFCYVSGAGTDSTETGRSMWARVKGKTENDLCKLPFGAVYLFRPGYIHPGKGLKNTHSFYKYIGWFYPLATTFFPGTVNSIEEIGEAMMNVVEGGYDRNVIEVKDIRALADRQTV